MSDKRQATNPSVPIALSFAAGVWLSGWASGPAWLWVVGSLAGAALGCGRPGRCVRALGLLVLWLSLGALRFAAWTTHASTLRALVPDHPAPVHLQGTLQGDLIEAPDDWGEGVHRGVLAVQAARQDGPWRRVRGLVQLTVRGAHPPVRDGDRVLLDGTWSRAAPAGNPGQYDRRASLARDGLQAVVTVAPADVLVIWQPAGGPTPRTTAHRIRRAAGEWLREHFSSRDAGVLLALLLGERGDLEAAWREAFQATGTMHLLVISGFHVGLIALGWELLLRLFAVPWRLRLAATALALGGYGMLTGMAPPVFRATLMAWSVLAALALDRAIRWGNVLATVALVLLWCRPTDLFDPSFQLSFGAVGSLIALAPAITRGVERRLKRVQPRGLRRALSLSVGATAAVWIGLLPLLTWYFYRLAPVALLANMLVTPLISVLVILGSGVLLLAAAAEPLAEWGVAPIRGLLALTWDAVRMCEAIPGGSWVVGRPSVGFCLAYAGLLAGIVWVRRRGGSWRGVRWAAGVLVVAGALAFGAARVARDRWLRVDVLDVGHGDSILVRRGGQRLLIDAGTESAGRWRVVPFLRHEGIGHLSALLVTHPDADHLGGILPVLRAMRVDQVLTNGTTDDTMTVRHVEEALRDDGVPQQVVRAGRSWVLGGVRIEVVHPPPRLVPGVPPDANDNSVVLRVSLGDVRVLLTGDLEAAGVPVLLAAYPRLRADVLQMPHHGSALGAAADALLERLRPRVALLSVGRRHGLPSAETLDALQRHHVPVLMTAAEGAIHLRTDGRRLEYVTHRGRRRVRIRP